LLNTCQIRRSESQKFAQYSPNSPGESQKFGEFLASTRIRQIRRRVAIAYLNYKIIHKKVTIKIQLLFQMKKIAIYQLTQKLPTKCKLIVNTLTDGKKIVESRQTIDNPILEPANKDYLA
jgi:hypothetical protein